MKIATRYLCAAVVLGGLSGLVWWVDLNQAPVAAEKVEHVHAVGDSPHRDEMDPCAGLELPGKYVPTKVHSPTGTNPSTSGMILHFKGRISQGHLDCIGDAAGVEGAWIPGMSHYQMVVVRAELYSWDEIKAGIENILRWGASSTTFLDMTGDSMETASCCIFQDGGSPAQTNKEK